MKTYHKHENHCRLIRKDLFETSARNYGLLAFLGGRKGIDFESLWVQRHIASCPRCQRRFSHLGRVNLAFSLLRSQPQPLSLVAKANRQTVAVLQKGVRQLPKAVELKTVLPNPTFLDQLRVARSQLTGLAACVTLLLLSKMGIFSSMESTQIQGRKAMQQYYSLYSGEDLNDEAL